MRTATATQASNSAYQDQIMTGAVNRCQQLIIDALQEHPRGMTRREIEQFTGLRAGTVTGRVNELRDKKIVMERVMRKCKITGRYVSLVELRSAKP